MQIIWECGRNAITWCFLKLFACHLNGELQELDGLPCSHVWKTHLVTKAQVIGILISIQQKTDRVEFQIDDGTGCVDAVLWTNEWMHDLQLGDLVHVEGKLQCQMFFHHEPNLEKRREIRITQVRKVDDPNEEILFWLQVEDCVKQSYDCTSSVALPTATAMNGEEKHARVGSSLRATSMEDVFFSVFFYLEIPVVQLNAEEEEEQQLQSTTLLLEILERLVQLQKVQEKPLEFTFCDLLESKDVFCLGSGGKPKEKYQARPLRRVFKKLRSSGLLFLEDEEKDRYVLITFERVFRVAIKDCPQNQALLSQSTLANNRENIAQVAENILTQPKFQRIPLEWLHVGIQMLMETGP